MILLSCEENYKNDGESFDNYCYTDDYGNTKDEDTLKMSDDLYYCMECVYHIHECTVGGAGGGNINDIRFLIII